MLNKSFFIGLGVLIAGCAALTSATSTMYSKQHKTLGKWNLVWEDNFELSELDTTKWTKIPPNKSDWGKHLSNDDACYSYKDGTIGLHGIVNYEPEKDPRPYLTGGIYTKGKFAFQYGKLEVRAKLSAADGAWPAIWMLAENDVYGDYPKNGEIDVMEHLNYDNLFYQTVHSYYTLEMDGTDAPLSYTTTPFDYRAYNVYGIEWSKNKLVFTLNGKKTLSYSRKKKLGSTQWPFDQPFYILVDQQLGGNWVGKVNPDDLPVTMTVDYVRVYQK